MSETCQNPFFPCTSPKPTEIALDILLKGERYRICGDCWPKIAESDYQWENQPKPMEKTITTRVANTPDQKLKKIHKF